MAEYIEDYQPVVKYNGLNTLKNTTIGGTLSVAGAITASGGIVGGTPVALETVPIGSVGYSSFGNNTATVAGSIFYVSLAIPRNFTVTNINVLQGATVGTDKFIGILYNSAGVAVANSATAGIITVGANTFLPLPLTTPYAAVGPGMYYVALQSNGTTDTFRSVAASTFVTVNASSQTGVFATLAAITPPTTFTANKGPIAYLN